jgi:hypothetical protein
MLSALVLAAPLALAGPGRATVDFSQGTQGWTGVVSGDGQTGSWIDDSLGVGAPAYHTTVNDAYWLHWKTSANTAFVGDYTASPSVTLGIDVLANSIVHNGNEVAREFVVELRDYDNAAPGAAYASVWYNLGYVAAGDGWQHLSVTIGDTSSLALPAGWGGDGATTGDGPSLPPGRTFASVLAGVDEVVFLMAQPGYVYGFTNFDVAVDNISISPVPEPASAGMLLGGLALLGAAARRGRARLA